MKHSVRISKIKKREAPKGMRKIVVNDITFFYKVGRYGEWVSIIDSNRNPFKEVYVGGDCTWRPSDIAQIIKQEISKQ